MVVPVFDEEENLRPLYEQITQTLGDGHSYEILFVDDGSRDGSLDVLAELQKNVAKVRIIQFRKNFGQTSLTEVRLRLNEHGLSLADS